MKITLFILLLSAQILICNDNSNHQIGFFAGLGLNIHSADFNRLPDCPSCSPGYRDGSGFGLSLAFVYDYKLSSSLYFSNRLIYNDLSGSLTQVEATNMIVNNQLVDGEFTHYLNSNLASVGIEPYVKYNAIGNLFLNFGFNLSALITSDYDQVEKISKPANVATFLDENGNNTFSRERNKFAGTLEFANSIYIAPIFSLSYQLPLNNNKTLYLEPEIAYYYGLSNIVLNDLVPEWTVSRLNFGLAIKYNGRNEVAKENIYNKELRIDTIKVEDDFISASLVKIGSEVSNIEVLENEISIITTEYITRLDTLLVPKSFKLDGSLTAVGIDENGNEVANPTFKIEEYVSNRLDPLLNYVFFGDNSSILPQRYTRLSAEQCKDFKINDLFRDSTLQLYYNILNIVGSRMKANSKAKLRLVGCNSDIDDEKGNINLSESRANAVKEYLVNVWAIPANNINIEKRNLPEKASTPKNESDKIAENRRVEIYSDNAKILEPIFIEKIDRNANPPIVRFKLNVNSDLPLKTWELKSFQESAGREFVQQGSSSVPEKVEWVLSDNQKITPNSDNKLMSVLTIEDERGQRKIINGNDLKIDLISIQEKRSQMQGDYEIEKFSLILFDFDKATIDGSNKSIMEFIKNRTKANSEIEIYGFTDRTGNAEYNQKLSEQRARETQRNLNRNEALAKGIGSSELLYNNDLPEGRFYCRTVNVIVKTKIK